jgi:hypothetical protein
MAFITETYVEKRIFELREGLQNKDRPERELEAFRVSCESASRAYGEQFQTWTLEDRKQHKLALLEKLSESKGELRNAECPYFHDILNQLNGLYTDVLQ